MKPADALQSAIKAAEESLNGLVTHYRQALGCCAACGDLFEIGMLAVVVADEEGNIQFEHESCSPTAEDYRSSYRNPQQLRPSGGSTTLTESGKTKLP